MQHVLYISTKTVRAAYATTTGYALAIEIIHVNNHSIIRLNTNRLSGSVGRRRTAVARSPKNLSKLFARLCSSRQLEHA
jgi:hypothetical protein